MHKFETLDLSMDEKNEGTIITTAAPPEDVMIFTDDEIIELQIHIFELIEIYLDLFISEYHKINFQKTWIEDITEHVFEVCLDIDFCEDTNECYDDLSLLVEKTIELYLEINPHDVMACRSYPDTRILNVSNNTHHKINTTLNLLKNTHQPKQKTEEWYQFRHNLITASNIGKVFGSPSAYNSLICEKCKPCVQNNYFLKSVSLHHGNKYEPLSILIYEKKYDTQLDEFGCIKHKKYEFIGASPDGINTNPHSPLYGRMVEVKNIYNRIINGIPSEMYWIQMQIQMEVCDLDECDFLETRFKEYENENAFYEDKVSEYKGVVLQFNGLEENFPLYVFMPLNIEITKSNVENWIELKKNEILKSSTEYVSSNVQYWYLDQWSCVLVIRNKKWFNEVVPNIQKIWETILKERTSGFEHRMPKQRFKVPPQIAVVEELKVVKSNEVMKF